MLRGGGSLSPVQESQPPAAAGRWWPWAAFPALALIMAAIEMAMGRVWWCQAGDLTPWSFDVWSQHNSQHLIDPYSLSHIEHGLGLYAVLSCLFAARMSVYVRALTTATVEAVWELVENTDWMIQRYREATISLDYFGDSIVNSIGDYGFCMLGVSCSLRRVLR